MKLLNLSLISLAFFFSCKSEFSTFQESALNYASFENNIDEQEYNKLIDEISASEDKKFLLFKNEKGEVDNQKLVDYLLKLFEAKKLNISAAEIWQPNSSNTPQPFNINVFLENSGSMNGYLNAPNTEFKNSIYSLLTRLKLFADKDSLNLLLINKGEQLLYKNASNTDVAEFKNILNPAFFGKLSKGKTGESDINELIRRCLSRVNNRNLSVFISDCVYSPGKSKPDATLFLADQKQGIYLNFATEIKNRNSDIAVVILQIDARFKGTYFDKQNTAIEIKSEISRPFYIWFIGTKYQITSILASKKLEELDGGYRNKLVFQTIENASQLKPKIIKATQGSFDRTEIAQGIITGAKAAKDGKFGFQIAVNFSNCLQDGNYYSSLENYDCSPSQYIVDTIFISDKNALVPTGYTHALNLRTNSLRDEVLKIKILGKTPSWVINNSSTDDSQILNSKTEQERTFGLKYLIEGVSEAFYPKSEENTINSITITIKK